MKLVLRAVFTVLYVTFLLFSLSIAAGMLSRWARAADISIYDSPSDKTKVVVEVCETTCARLITPKATLEEDYVKINAWAATVMETLK